VATGAEQCLAEPGGAGVSAVQEATALAASGETSHDVVIEPPSRWGDLGLAELWRSRELLYFLVKRDLQIRYKQSVFGVSWAVLQPVALTLIFYVFFGRLAKVPHEDVPYPLFAMAALVPWTFASNSVGQAAASLVGDQNLISKVYFPRLVIPLARIGALGIDLGISLVVLAVFMAAYGVAPPAEAVLVPLILLLALVTAAGVGVWLAALNVKYRDVSVAVPLLVQIWLFATPVVYPGSLVTGAWQYIYALNPMVSVVGLMRWALLGTAGPPVGAVAVSVASAAVVLAFAVIRFRRTERFFADII
jgi:lipopolysaccharide transport system permease protein